VRRAEKLSESRKTPWVAYMYPAHMLAFGNSLKRPRHFYSSKILLPLEKAILSGEERDCSRGAPAISPQLNVKR